MRFSFCFCLFCLSGSGLLLKVELVAGLLLEQIEHSLQHIVVIDADIGHLVVLRGVLVLDHLEDHDLAVIVLRGQKDDILVALILDRGAELKFNIDTVFVGQDNDVIVFHIFHIIHG